MNWTKRHAYCWQSDAGYRIAAARVGERILYSAFAPPMDDNDFKNKCKARYAIGESVPQQRVLLGTFDDATVAREACEADMAQRQGVMI